jgi:hypothetical protein
MTNTRKPFIKATVRLRPTKKSYLGPSVGSRKSIKKFRRVKINHLISDINNVKDKAYFAITSTAVYNNGRDYSILEWRRQNDQDPFMHLHGEWETYNHYDARKFLGKYSDRRIELTQGSLMTKYYPLNELKRIYRD